MADGTAGQAGGNDLGQQGPAFGRMVRPQTLPQALVAVMDAQDHLEAAMAAQLGAEGAFYDLQAKTDGLEQAAVQRLVGTPNLASGKTPPAPHSATSAASVAATADAELRDHLAAVRSAGRVKAVAEHQASVARNRIRSLRLIAAALMLEPATAADVPFLAACGNALARSLLAVSDAHPDHPKNRERAGLFVGGVRVRDLTDEERASGRWPGVTPEEAAQVQAQRDRDVAAWEASVKANPPQRVTDFDSAPGGYRDGRTGLEFGPPLADGTTASDRRHDAPAHHIVEFGPDAGRVVGDVSDDIADDIAEANSERPDGGQIRGE
jgi:hypothetical protein